MKKLLIIILFFFIATPIAFGADVCASGWGQADVNGTWTDRGITVNGKPSYLRGIRFAYWPSDGNGWYLSGPDVINTCPKYYDNSAAPVATPDLVTNWIQGCSSDAIYGTVTAGACAGGGGVVESIVGLVRAFYID